MAGGAFGPGWLQRHEFRQAVRGARYKGWTIFTDLARWYLPQL